jgi:hypothetical protein
LSETYEEKVTVTEVTNNVDTPVMVTDVTVTKNDEVTEKNFNIQLVNSNCNNVTDKNGRDKKGHSKENVLRF